jgi:hypothetical protein
MLNRRSLCVGLTLAVLPGTALASSPADPITAIYKRAAAGKGEEGGTFIFLEQRDRPRWLSKSLTALWNAEDRKTPKGDQTPPGFDPVSNSQDPLVREPKVEVEKSDSKTAVVAATFLSRPWKVGEPDARITVRYDMVLENGHWKIDDIRGSSDDGKEWSIRAIIKGWNPS